MHHRSRFRIGVSVLGIAMTVATTAVAGAPPPEGPVGGEYRLEADDHLSDEQRRDIEEQIARNIDRLRREGRLPAPVEAHPLLQWPLRTAGLSDPGYHGVSNFVDQNAAFPNQLRDYNCGTRTYDTTSGYNHRGVDYFLWPFSWRKMDQDEVQVIAAAPGTIILRQDGNFDRSCSFNNNNWNAVYVRHADNSVAWYGHLKNGSVTPKPVGATVVAGEYLGIVGSSGNSSGPHLHLEVYDSSGALHDPYQGSCNTKNPTTWWLSQRPYHDSALNHLATAFAPPDFPACPNPESPNESDSFVVGSPIYFAAYYRDQIAGQSSRYRIYRPDGTVYSEWLHGIADPHYAASYWYWYYSAFAPAGPTGTWRFEILLNGTTTTHEFELTTVPAAGRVPESGGGPQPPLTVTKQPGGSLTLDWGASCRGSDTDYEVYAGTLGIFYDHAPRTCSTAGANSATFAPGAANEYYLVVPANGLREGSYGQGVAGAERPRLAGACLPSSIAGCP